MRSLLLVLLMMSPAHAAETVSDAFGIVPTAALSEKRAAWSGLKSGETSVRTEPEGAEAVLLFVGPKSLVAGREDGHAAALVLDRHGNLAGDDMPVEFALGDELRADGRTRNGIADVAFRPAPVAGTYSAGASVAGQQSTRVFFDVTADIEGVRPGLNSATARAETLATITTGALADSYGNVVEDGIALPLVIQHDDGRFSLATALTKQGEARFDLLARGIGMGGTMQTSVAGNGSPRASYDLDRLYRIGDMQVLAWPVTDLNALGLRIGPIMTDAGHLLTDGALVRVTIAGSSGQLAEADGWLRDGYYETVLALDPSDRQFDVTVTTVLGRVSQNVELTDAPARLQGAE